MRLWERKQQADYLRFFFSGLVLAWLGSDWQAQAQLKMRSRPEATPSKQQPVAEWRQALPLVRPLEKASFGECPFVNSGVDDVSAWL